MPPWPPPLTETELAKLLITLHRILEVPGISARLRATIEGIIALAPEANQILALPLPSHPARPRAAAPARPGRSRRSR